MIWIFSFCSSLIARLRSWYIAWIKCNLLGFHSRVRLKANHSGLPNTGLCLRMLFLLGSIQQRNEVSASKVEEVLLTWYGGTCCVCQHHLKRRQSFSCSYMVTAKFTNNAYFNSGNVKDIDVLDRQSKSVHEKHFSHFRSKYLQIPLIRDDHWVWSKKSILWPKQCHQSSICLKIKVCSVHENGWSFHCIIVTAVLPFFWTIPYEDLCFSLIMVSMDNQEMWALLQCVG